MDVCCEEFWSIQADHGQMENKFREEDNHHDIIEEEQEDDEEE